MNRPSEYREFRARELHMYVRNRLERQSRVFGLPGYYNGQASLGHPRSVSNGSFFGFLTHRRASLSCARLISPQAPSHPVILLVPILNLNFICTLVHTTPKTSPGPVTQCTPGDAPYSKCVSHDGILDDMRELRIS
jgi:hypothetical protein